MGDTRTVVRMLLLRLLGRMVMRMMSVDVVTGVLLLPLGAPVLKPDLHLRLGESECKRQAQTLTDGQVASQAELALERRQLIVAERCSSPTAAGPASGVVAADVVATVAARIRQHLPVIARDTFVGTTVIGCDVRSKAADNTAVVVVFSLIVGAGLQQLNQVVCVR